MKGTLKNQRQQMSEFTATHCTWQYSKVCSLPAVRHSWCWGGSPIHLYVSPSWSRPSSAYGPRSQHWLLSLPQEAAWNTNSTVKPKQHQHLSSQKSDALLTSSTETQLFIGLFSFMKTCKWWCSSRGIQRNADTNKMGGKTHKLIYQHREWNKIKHEHNATKFKQWQKVQQQQKKVKQY